MRISWTSAKIDCIFGCFRIANLWRLKMQQFFTKKYHAWSKYASLSVSMYFFNATSLFLNTFPNCWQKKHFMLVSYIWPFTFYTRFCPMVWSLTLLTGRLSDVIYNVISSIAYDLFHFVWYTPLEDVKKICTLDLFYCCGKHLGLRKHF